MRMLSVRKKAARTLPVVLYTLITAMTLFSNLPVTQAAGWISTGFNPVSLTPYDISDDNKESCFDSTQPDILMFRSFEGGSLPKGTYSFNWRTGQQALVSPLPFEVCDSKSGYMFAKETDKIYRFSINEPAGRLVERMPTEFARDASQLMYAVGYSDDKNIYTSHDAGLTWQNITNSPVSTSDEVGVNSIYSLPGDAESVYALDCFYHRQDDCALYFSSNAGQRWELHNKRFISELQVNSYIVPINGLGTPVGYVLIAIGTTGMRKLILSTDGGYSFSDMGSYHYNDSPHGGPSNQEIRLYYTGRHLVRFTYTPDRIAFEASEDGKTWTSQALPPGIETFNRSQPPHLSRLSFSDSEFVISYVPQGSTQYTTWTSTNDAKNWAKLEDSRDVRLVTPYLPSTLFSFEDNNLSFMSYPDADHFATNGIKPTNSANSLYFPETKHTLTGAIRRFWEQHGGLAQFGYPLTEVIRQYNPTDGKIYAVQYFERNRLEYHPELASTPYEVELGLLGNQLTQNRQNEGPFRPIANLSQLGFTYFPQTEHTLAHTFKEYWEAHGGLAIYGYPTSEEFQEVNPSDGQTYTVQYFERNRFEYHPEFKNTPYEVLLGLLGNQLLAQKGWL